MLVVLFAGFARTAQSECMNGFVKDFMLVIFTVFPWVTEGGKQSETLFL